MNDVYPTMAGVRAGLSKATKQAWDRLKRHMDGKEESNPRNMGSDQAGTGRQQGDMDKARR